MSQTKAQLIAPIGVVTASGIVASGVVTASSFDGNVTGSATSIIQGANLNVGIMSASGFSGDFTGTATGITTGSDIKVGAFTASSFTGDFTGTATSMMRGTGFEAGAVNATGFVANVVGNVTGNVTGNVSVAGSVTSGGNIHVGVMTATSYSGDGSTMTGIAATNFNTQTVTANASETIIDLANGNCITMDQSANTAVGFASTATAMSITLIRTKDSSATARTITWPESVTWNGGTAPTLISDGQSGDSQQFHLITRDSGLTWYGWENFERDGMIVDLYTWGEDETGQLGLNQSNVPYSSPVQIPGTTWKNYISGSGKAIGGIKTDGTLWTWGADTWGQAGHNTRIPTGRSSPTQVGTDTTWAYATMGTKTFATKTDGTLWVCGANYGDGGLGLNDDVNYSSPVQLPGTTWTTNWSISASYSSFAIKSDNTLWSWGDGGVGQLAQGNKTSYSSPVQVPGSWAAVRAGRQCKATKTDGTLWAWGMNENGSLGQNQNHDQANQVESPIQIPGTTWPIDQRKFNQNKFIKTDGTLWGVGKDHRGQLGQNSTSDGWSSPVQIGTGTDWQYVGGIWASKTDGTLWYFGQNDSGQLGQNSNVWYSSPVQVPGTWEMEPVLGFGGGQGGFKKAY